MNREALTAAVAPDEPVPEVLPHGSGQVSQGRLAGGEGFTSRHVHRLDLLHGHGIVSHVHRAAAAILIVLSLPDKFGLHLREDRESVWFQLFVIVLALPISCRRIADILPINHRHGRGERDLSSQAIRPPPN